MKKSVKMTIISSVLTICIFGCTFFFLFVCENISGEPFVPAINTLAVQERETNYSSEGSNSSNSLTAQKAISADMGDVAEQCIFDLNTASSEELESINGIGSEIAKRIIAYRTEHGRFYSIDELDNIKGIGKAKLKDIRNYLYVEAVETAAMPPEQVSPAETAVPASFTEAITQTVPAVMPEQEETSAPAEKSSVIAVSEKPYYTTKPAEAETTSIKYMTRFPIELNSATTEDLMCISGIGEALAARIVLYAQAYGFYSVDDLLNVQGIGEYKLNSIRYYVYADASGLPPKETTVTTTALTSVSVTATTAVTTVYTPRLPIELNSASIEELKWLPGIGETTAIKIIVYAQQNGFYSVDDLLKVSGIGKTKLDVIRPYVYADASGLPPIETTQTTAITVTTETPVTTEPVIKVNLNTCNKAELMTVPGINENIADNILNFRDIVGEYTQLEELYNIEGMTENLFCQVTPYLYI